MKSVWKSYKEEIWKKNLAGKMLDDFEIEYLKLKLKKKKRCEIIRELNLQAEHYERQIRKVILAKLEVDSIFKALIKANELNLINFNEGQPHSISD